MKTLRLKTDILSNSFPTLSQRHLLWRLLPKYYPAQVLYKNMHLTVGLMDRISVVAT